MESPIAAGVLSSPDMRPGFRWWWQPGVGSSELVRELGAMSEAGFGEVEIAFNPQMWANSEQRSALHRVLLEAKARNVRVAITLGAEWPLRTPNTSAGTPHAMKEIQNGACFIAAGENGPIEIPQPFDASLAERPARLMALVRADVLARGDSPTVVQRDDPYNPGTDIIPPERSTIIDAASLRCIELPEGSHSVPWESRDVDSVLVALWQRDTAQGVCSILERDAALEAARYIEENQLGPENLRLLREVGTDLFEDSLELNADSLFWTPDLLDRFRGTFDYDLRPFLPLLFAHGMCRYWVPNEEPVADFDTADSTGARIRHDYYRLLTDMYIDNHLTPLQQWAEKLGLRYKSQVAYGQDLEAIRSNRALASLGGHPEGESLDSGDRAPMSRDNHTWRFALDWQRAIVSGAHQGGATRISTELGAQFQAAYMFSLGDYQQMLNKEWAAGITRPFVHGYASQPPKAVWPTQSRFYDLCAEGWNDRNFPEWRNWKPLTDYWTRGTAFLESGSPRTDVAVLRDGFLTTAARGAVDVSEDLTAPDRLIDSEALEQDGYSIGFVDPLGLQEAELGGDSTLFPDGPAYRALIVEESEMPAATAEAISRLASRGFRIVFVGTPPYRDSSYADAERQDERVRTAISTALTFPSATRVESMEDVPGALKSHGVTARTSFSGAPLLTQWRHSPEKDRILLYNTSDDAVSADISAETSGAVYRLDLFTGDAERLPSRSQDHRSHFSVDFNPLELVALEVVPAGGEMDESTTSPARTSMVPLADWNLEVTGQTPDGWTTPVVLPGAGPADWRSIEAIKDMAGIGTYTARVDAPDDVDLSGAVLTLGEIQGSATIRVGDQTFGPVYTSHSAIRLGDALNAERTIEIEVRTPLRNAVAASGPRIIPIVETQPLGLIGPVRLEIAPDDRAGA